MIIEKIDLNKTINKIISKKVAQTLSLLETTSVPSAVLLQVKNNFWNISDEIKRDIFGIEIKERGVKADGKTTKRIN